MAFCRTAEDVSEDGSSLLPIRACGNQPPFKLGVGGSALGRSVAQWATKEIANPRISVAKSAHVEMRSLQALDASNIERNFLLVSSHREHSSACV